MKKIALITVGLVAVVAAIVAGAEYVQRHHVVKNPVTEPEKPVENTEVT